MFCTCLSNASCCCSFVLQPGKAGAFHRSPCRNPPSLQTRKAMTHRPTQSKVKATKAKSEGANRRHVGTRKVSNSQTRWLIMFPLTCCCIRWYLNFPFNFSFILTKNKKLGFNRVCNTKNTRHVKVVTIHYSLKRHEHYFFFYIQAL